MSNFEFSGQESAYWNNNQTLVTMNEHTQCPCLSSNEGNQWKTWHILVGKKKESTWSQIRGKKKKCNVCLKIISGRIHTQMNEWDLSVLLKLS